MSQYQTIAHWPNCSTTEDKHPTKEAAEGVAALLRQNGYGADGKVFPTKVEVVELNSRLTLSIVTPRISEQEAAKELDNARRQMPGSDEISSARVTYEVWNGNAWVIKDTFLHENRDL